MRIVILALLAAAFSLSFAGSASAQGMGHCSHEPTVAALRTCVEHAIHHGHIDSAGVGRSLLAKLDGAQAALERGQPAVAINKLEAFIHELDAQAGAHIEAEHAAHLRAHARDVIAALGG